VRIPRLLALLLTLSVAAMSPAAVAQSIDQLIEQGSAAQASGKYTEAENIWRKVIEINPKLAAAYNNIGYNLYYQGKLDDAIAAFRQAIQIQPDSIRYNNLGIVLFNQGKLEEAIVAFKQAIQIDPKYPPAHYGLGYTFYNQGKIQEAIEAYRQTIQIEPKFAAAYNNLGIALKDQGKLEEAEAAYRQALALPDDKTPPTVHTLAHNNLGRLLQQQDKLEAAIAEFEQAVAIDPKFVTAQNNLKEAQRLLSLRLNPPLPVVDDRKWLPKPEDEPLVGVLRSVVRIVAEIPTGSNIGAGWVLKREGNTAWIVTNRHVVSDVKGAGKPSKKIELEFYSEPPPGQFPPRYPAKILQITAPGDSLDLALLEVTGIPDDIQPLPVHIGKVGRTTTVRVIGHPSNGGDWSAVPGEVSNVLPQEQKLQIVATLAEGNSGGPVINDQKQVVGLMVQNLCDRKL